MESITAKQKQLERMKKWREANKEKIKEYNKEWRRTNKEHRKEYKKKYRDENREKHLSYSREYYWKKVRTSRLSRPRDKIGEKRYKDAHKEEIRSKNVIRLRAARAVVISGYGGKCACCGEAEPNFLTIDHVNNDGNVMRKNKVHPPCGYGLYKWLEKKGFPKEFQILCYNCNMAKSRYGICPHEKVRSSSKD